MKKYLISSLFVLTALSSVAHAEDAGAAMMVKLNALNTAKVEIEARATLEKQKMEMIRASTTARMEMEKGMMQARMASTTAKMEIRKEDMKERIASTTAFLKDKREEIKSDIEKRIGKKLEGERKEIAQKYENVLKSLNNLVTRVESRIAKMKAAGTDTTSIQASLDAAKIQISIANSDLASFEILLATGTSTATSTRKEISTAIQTANKKAKADAETAYKSLMKVINALTPERKEVRASSTKTEVHATTSVQ